MNLLLDTHVLLWWLADEPILSQPARRAIADGGNTAFVSAVTVWEIVIKQAIGKLNVPDDFQELLAREPFGHLDIRAEHAFRVRALPPVHRDPFDRMLVAQSQVESLTLVTRDHNIMRYGVPVLEA